MMERLDFHYVVEDDRLIAYSRLSALQRLRWLDEVRRFTLMVRDGAAVRVTPSASWIRSDGQGRPRT